MTGIREIGETLRSQPSTDLDVADVEQALHGTDSRQKFLNNNLVIKTQLARSIIARRPQHIPADAQQCSSGFVAHILRIFLEGPHATFQALVHVDVDHLFAIAVGRPPVIIFADSSRVAGR